MLSFAHSFSLSIKLANDGPGRWQKAIRDMIFQPMLLEKGQEILFSKLPKIMSWNSWEEMVGSLKLKTSMEPVHPPRAANIGCGRELDLDKMVVCIGLFVSSAHICGHGEVGERNLVMKNAAESMANEINGNAKLEGRNVAEEVEEPDPVSSQACDFLHPSVH